MPAISAKQLPVAGALALGAYGLAGQAFVTPGSAPLAATEPAPGLRGAAMAPVGGAASPATTGACSNLAALAGGAAGAAALLSMTMAKPLARRRGRPLRAEPVTAAAAAAAAAKAAGGAAAAKGASAAGAAAAQGAKISGASVASGGMLGGDAARPKGGAPDEKFDPATQIGVTAPFGYFDPAGFCKIGDTETFRNNRTAEIKHGRVAMMAAVGGVAQHYIKFPGFEKVPSGLAAVTQMPGNLGFAALFLVAGLLETTAWSEDVTKEPGNFGDPLGLNQYTEDMRNREINNGRMAMFAALGIVAADLLTGKDGVQQLAALGL